VISDRTVAGKDSGRRAASWSNGHRDALTISSVAQAGQDVGLGQVGEVFEDFVVGHAGGEVAQDVVNGDAHATDAGFAAAFTRFDGDDVLVLHGSISELRRVVGVSLSGGQSL